jgi:hypothetical protein
VRIFRCDNETFQTVISFAALVPVVRDRFRNHRSESTAEIPISVENQSTRLAMTFIVVVKAVPIEAIAAAAPKI